MRALFVALALALGLAIGGRLAPVAPMPRCEEDAVLVGAGAFDAGRWSAYACGPAVDDYQDTKGPNR